MNGLDNRTNDISRSTMGKCLNHMNFFMHRSLENGDHDKRFEPLISSCPIVRFWDASLNNSLRR